MLPQRNATLTAVNSATGGEAFDGPPAAGAAKWAGQAGCYYRERRDRRRTAEGEDRIVSHELIVETQNPPIAWKSGDRVAFAFGAESLTGTVRLVERRRLPQVPGPIETTRLTLELT